MINEMVNKFLSWKLPKDFCPDGGISFSPGHTTPSSPHWPTGTNLFHAEQAKKMFEFCCVNLQTQLAERGEIILEQQARIEELRYWLEEMQKCAAEENKGLLGTEFALLNKDNLSVLEAALKAERIKTLEDAIESCYSLTHAFKCHDELRRMANDLSEQS